MKHRYWVAFSTGAGGGAGEVLLNLPMRTGADVEIVKQLIREQYRIVGPLVITSWTKFEDAS